MPVLLSSGRGRYRAHLRRGAAACALAYCALLLGAAPAFAQTQGTPTAPPSREQSTPPVAPGTLPPANVTINDDKAIETGPCPIRGDTHRVAIRSIRFEGPGGSEVPPVLLPLLAEVKPPQDEMQPVDAVCDIRDFANAVLRRRGYVTSVVIPAQDLSSGELRLTVVSGRIIGIKVRSTSAKYRSLIDQRVEQLKAIYPLNTREAQHVLLLAGDVPGLDVGLVLLPAGKEPGELVADLNVDVQSVVAVANVQNTGSRQLGRELATGRFDFYGLTGLADQSFISYTNSLQWREQRVVQIGHDMGIGSSGLRIGAAASYALSKPSITGIDIRSVTTIADAHVSYPLIRTLNGDLSVRGAMEFITQRTTSAGVPLFRDHVRVASLRVDGRLSSTPQPGSVGQWTLSGYVELRQGLNIFNATQTNERPGGFSATRLEGDAEATVIRARLDAHSVLSEAISVDTAFFAQWANKPLLNIEEFSLGNFTFGRGYDPGASGGDEVVAFRLEPRARLFSLFGVRLEASAFYDHIRLWNLDQAFGSERKRRLESAGLGVRAILPGRLILDLNYARPLRRALATDDTRPTDRFLFSITSRLFGGGQRQ